MTCREFVEFLWQYVQGELPEAQRRTFDVHLASCPDCVHYLRDYRETIRLGRAAFAAGDAEVPADIPEDLVLAVLEARSSQARALPDSTTA